MSSHKIIHHSVKQNSIAEDNASDILTQLIEGQTEAYLQHIFALFW